MNKKKKKRLFRKTVLRNIKKRKINSYKKDKLLILKLFKFIKKNKYRNIMLYIPLKTEVNIAYLIKLLRENRYNLFVPFMEDKSFKLVKYRLPLYIKKFGIKEPKNSKLRVKNIDLAIVPILGVDKNYKRVGFGKGMYDRFYEKFGNDIKKTLFIARDLYYTEEIITDSYDIKADYIMYNSKIEIKKDNLCIN